MSTVPEHDVGNVPEVAADSVGWVDRAGMIEVDRVMIEDLGIELLQMMENTGRSLARLAIERFDPARVLVAAGSGGNGGGGMVAARHLANAGVDVAVVTTRPADDMRDVPAHQRRILHAMGVPSVEQDAEAVAAAVDDADLVLDAVIGSSLSGPPTGRSAMLIEATADARVLSLDVPSGLDVDTGTAPGAVVRPEATLTLALPKVGLRSAAVVGELYLADISVPRSVTDPMGGAPDFRAASILRLRT